MLVGKSKPEANRVRLRRIRRLKRLMPLRTVLQLLETQVMVAKDFGLTQIALWRMIKEKLQLERKQEHEGLIS